MTTTTDTVNTAPTRSFDLRTVLRIDAATCAGTGLLLAAAAGPLDEVLGTGRPGIVRAVGVFLLAYAADLVLLARGCTSRLRQLVPVTVAADGAWVLGTAAGIALGWFEPLGVALAAGAAAVVAALAVAKVRVPAER